MADSVADYSLVQGQSNWCYGYCCSNYSVGGFEPFSATARCCDLGACWWTGKNVSTSMWQWGGRPNGLDGHDGRDPVLECAVRRWITTAAGLVSIQGVTSASSGGDTTAEIYVDGARVFAAPVTNTAHTPYSLLASVSVGGVMDFVIRTTGTNASNGWTTFTGRIQEGGAETNAGSLPASRSGDAGVSRPALPNAPTGLRVVGMGQR